MSHRNRALNMASNEGRRSVLCGIHCHRQSLLNEDCASLRHALTARGATQFKVLTFMLFVTLFMYDSASPYWTVNLYAKTNLTPLRSAHKDEHKQHNNCIRIFVRLTRYHKCFIHCNYRGADNSLARPGRKQGRATEDFEFHLSYL